MTIPITIREVPKYYSETLDGFGATDAYTVSIGSRKIKTVVTKNALAVDHWIEKIYNTYADAIARSEKKESKYRFIVALDMEVKPDYDEGPKSVDASPIATLQLCVFGSCLIYQISRSYQVYSRSLRDFLQDENIRFVGVGIEDVAIKLQRDFDLRIERAVDLRDLAAEKYGKKKLKKLGLMGLVWKVLDYFSIVRPKVTVTNWNQKHLTQEQIMSACVDAYLTFEIAEHLSHSYGVFWVDGFLHA